MSIDSHIKIYKNNNKKISEQEILEITSILESIDSIDEFYIEEYSRAILKDRNYSEGVIVKSIIKSKSKKIHSLIGSEKIHLLSEGECVIGKELKDKLFINKNSKITLLNTDFINSGILYNAGLTSKVTDNIYFGISELDKSIIYINKKDFAKTFNNDRLNANNVKIFLNDIYNQDSI